MGSKSDWDVMRQADEVLTKFGVDHECRVLSAHRTPKETTEYVSAAEGRGMEVIIAAAGGAAHLAGVCAAHTLLPVLGVPRSEEHMSELQSRQYLVCRPLLEKKKNTSHLSCGLRAAALLRAVCWVHRRG